MLSLVLALALTAPAATEDAAATAKAKTLFTEGQKLYKAGKFGNAVKKFEEAYATRPHPVIFFNVGKCYEQLGDVPKALRNFRDYLRLLPNANDKQQVMDSVANLERRLREKGQQQVLFFVEPTTAKLLVDGVDLGAIPASTELSAGEHKLVATADGMEKVERTFTVTLTRSQEISVVLEPPKPVAVSDAPKKDPEITSGTNDGPPPPPPPVVTADAEKKGGRVVTWVVGGVAVASLGAGIGLGLAAEGNAKQLRETPTPLSKDQANQFANSANSLAIGADVAYATAGVAAAVAVVLFILEK